ncbi:DoxX family protein (plasmid) [Deinococcus taeanensis]|uniref:DoxX family protein n=1 Tax=Deinococcus taeanensis TaxID=2737050 RepID=UPI001CDD2A74|nr:DoxX family protein [Deinococcus taeanensis]UBV44246.1 DoxX family protein [Deinococcus taeanensis]
MRFSPELHGRSSSRTPVQKGSEFTAAFNLYEARLVGWWARHGITLLRLSLGLIFFWFGVQKFFPGMSSAEGLATHTISVLTFGLVPAQASLPLLATWECAIGLGLLSGRFLRVTVLLLLLQMAGTFLPLIFFPEETFKVFPLVPNLEGQYIIKNLVLISGALVVGATSRGGALIADPKAARSAERMQAVHARFRRRFHREP